MRYQRTKQDESLEERSARRRQRMVTHVAVDHDDAEKWDLNYWQRAGFEARLDALVAIREDIALVGKRR